MADHVNLLPSRSVAEPIRFSAGVFIRVGGETLTVCPAHDMTGREAFELMVFLKRFSNAPNQAGYDPESVREWLAERNLLRHFRPG